MQKTAVIGDNGTTTVTRTKKGAMCLAEKLLIYLHIELFAYFTGRSFLFSMDLQNCLDQQTVLINSFSENTCD